MSLIVCRSIGYRRALKAPWMFVSASVTTYAVCVEKGWSQERFADEAGIHRTYVSDIERGARNPTIMIVEKLAKPFAVSLGELLD